MILSNGRKSQPYESNKTDDQAVQAGYTISLKTAIFKGIAVFELNLRKNLIELTIKPLSFTFKYPKYVAIWINNYFGRECFNL